MSTHRIIMEMEGPSAKENHLDLQDFLEKAGHLKAFLNSLVKHGEHKEVGFKLVRLSHSSPAVMECEPYGINAALIMKECEKYLSFVNEEKAASIPYPIFSTIENLAKLKPQRIPRLELKTIEDTSNDMHIWKFDDVFRNNLVQAKDEDDVQIDTIDGKLEAVDIHGKPYVFKIFTWAPIVASVKCIFPKSMLEQVRSALGRWVSVSGECRNRPDAIMPYEIQVREEEELEVMPPSDELPTLSDLYGIAPELTDGQSPEEFVRKLRDQWD